MVQGQAPFPRTSEAGFRALPDQKDATAYLPTLPLFGSPEEGLGQ